MDITRDTVGNATAISFEQEESSSIEQNYAPTYNLGNQTVIMNKIQAQNMLTAVHQQFHQNQGKYIDLLSKVVEYQAVLLEQSENSSVYPKAMQNLEQMLQILQNNQFNYHANHEAYLQSQLALIRGEEFTPNITNTLDDSSALRVPSVLNDSISETEKVLPSTKSEEQKTVNPSDRQSARIIVTPPVTEQLPEVAPSSNGMNGNSPRQVANDIISETERVLPPTKSEEQKTVNASDRQSASSRTASATGSPKATLRSIILTSESINHSVETKKPEEQKTVKASTSQSDSNAPASATVSPKATPSSEPVTMISENISHPVESTSSANDLSTPALSSTTSISVTQLSNRLLAVVSDKTGYPVDMLDLSMDLEADLGIDSIKQVQIFASMQEEFPNIELDTEMLAELRTLAQVIDYMKDYLSTDQTTPLSNDFHEHGAIERQLVKKN
ncbi:phosphopantetheine-binding protein [Nostoc sp. ChiQUE01b]|uniref:phosphopantetheine-binding protein n=1 Tax=Nostoc sp. ChiQUE01b TaxID=3075376 RepID=UPI002AD59631|nr:phosphopantetheine-binding protein [Nostoc sp. ChiQUE01b]MDZ8260454.1 phosphopantetheine-binding protein [Nostoc sp. ChiQUE01b]